MFQKPKPNPNTCERCPQRYSERGCPCWISVTETNEVTGVVRARNGCFYEIIPEWLSTLATAGNRVAAGTHSMRNEIVRRQDALAEGVAVAFQLIGQQGPPEALSEVQYTPPLEALPNAKS